MKLTIKYFDNGYNQKIIDSKDWIKEAPNGILKIFFEIVSGTTHEITGYGAYFCIDDYIGGFNTIKGVGPKGVKYFPCDDFVVDSRIKMGHELTDEEWSKFEKVG